jgi:hypothetical protein
MGSNRICISKLPGRSPPRLACWPHTDSQVLESRTELIGIPIARGIAPRALDFCEAARQIDEFSKVSLSSTRQFMFSSGSIAFSPNLRIYHVNCVNVNF